MESGPPGRLVGERTSCPARRPSIDNRHHGEVVITVALVNRVPDIDRGEPPLSRFVVAVRHLISRTVSVYDMDAAFVGLEELADVMKILLDRQGGIG